MASKQLWRWHGITGDGNAQDGMLWAESRALLLMALQQQMAPEWCRNVGIPYLLGYWRD